MAHRLDAMLGTRSAELSESDEWKDLSGWQSETIINPDTGASFRQWTLRGWEYEWRRSGSGDDEESTETVDPTRPRTRYRVRRSDPNAEDFVRDYAATQPGEDFADTLAWYRFEPALTIQKSPRKSAFFRERVYGGRSFDETGLFDAYEVQAAAALRPQLLAIVQGCVAGDAPPAAPPTGSPTLTFEGAVPRALTDCIAAALF